MRKLVLVLITVSLIQVWAQNTPEVKVVSWDESAYAYPPEAREARIQGAVTVGFEIDTNGKATQVRVVNGHPMLASAAEHGVKAMRFECAKCETGKPVQRTMKFVFALKGEVPNITFEMAK